MTVPSPVAHILSRLNSAGYEAYAVGGCVRDTLLGKTPQDWDICTSALPSQTDAVFGDCHVIETGLKHGTVTVMLDHIPYEITTFRQDGEYSDHRRPQQVSFVKSLREDLARRDFTVNAMAAGPDGTVTDCFGGQADLNDGIIRCVGDPEARFREDALRILRGLRFAATLDFSIASETAAAMDSCKDLLQYVSPERIYVELTKLLAGKAADTVLSAYSAVITQVLPEITPAVGFEQRNPYHNRDVWGHTLEALGHSQPEPEIRWALLLHDLGKPKCFTLDERGIGHFYGHPLESEAMTREIFHRLRSDKKTRETVAAMVRYHDYDVPATKKHAKRWVQKFGPELALKLLEVKRCDCLAHAMTPKARARYENTLALMELVQQVIREAPCLSLKDLAITGRDVIRAGIAPGPQVGVLLEALLEDVLEERCPNEPQALMARLQLSINRRRKELP